MKRELLLGVAVGAAFMALAFWGVPLGQLGEAFSEMDARYLLVVTALFAVQESLRALRQWVMLRPVAPAMSYSSSLSIFFISFFCIHIFPARLGEFVRPWLLKRREGVPLGSGLGMVVAERAVDLVAALVMLWIVLVWAGIPSDLEVGGVQIPLVDAGRSLGIAVVPAAIAGCLGLAFFGERTQALLAGLAAWVGRALPAAARPAELAVGFAAAFAQGFASFRSPGRLAAILGLTATTWGSTAFIYVVLADAFGFGELVDYAEGVGVMVITMLGSLLPAPPGMAGVQEAFGRGALALFGVSGEGLDGPALAYAITVHWFQVLLQSTAAGWFFWRDGESLKELARRARETEASELEGGGSTIE